MRTHIHVSTAILALSALALLGCEETYDTGADITPPAPTDSNSSDFDPSRSDLGKARDAARGVLDDVEERDAGMGRMIDDMQNPRGDGEDGSEE